MNTVCVWRPDGAYIIQFNWAHHQIQGPYFEVDTSVQKAGLSSLLETRETIVVLHTPQ